MGKSNVKKEVYSYVLVIVGSLLFAIGDIMFSNPYHLAPGGTWGLSNVINALAPWKVSLYAICMDIPLLIIGTIIIGPKFGVKTVLSTILIFVFAHVLEFTWGYHPVIQQGIYNSLNDVPEALQSLLVQVPYREGGDLLGRGGVDSVFYFMPDYMLNTLVAGLIYGFAIGLIFKSGATSGGSDIISMIIHKYTKISLGTLVIIVDGIITCSTMFINQTGSTDVATITANLRLPLNSFIVVFIEGIIIDLVVDGFKKPSTLIISTTQPQAVASFIKNELHRNTECVVNNNMVVATLRHNDSTKLKIKMNELDPEAFITVMESKETYGFGYKELPRE